MLLDRMHGGEADVVVGLFPTDQPEHVGVVDFDESSVVRGISSSSGLKSSDRSPETRFLDLQQ